MVASNRIVLSPLCMYSATEGVPNDWHFSHLSTYARAGVGIVFTEATAVQKIGRITPFCCGLWNDKQVEKFSKIAGFIKEMGSIPAIQLAHAGRKASAREPWKGGGALDNDDKRRGIEPWQSIAPSAISIGKGWQVPVQMTYDDIKKLIKDYVNAAKRSITAGFEVLEIHAAHGYLLHSFLSPLANKRNDDFGGSQEGRMRLLKNIIVEIRKVIPDKMPLFCRISAIDGIDNGWTIEDSIKLAKTLKKLGVDLIDCSSGGIIGRPRFAVDDSGKILNSNTDRGLGFQVPLAYKVRKSAQIKTMAVGVIINAEQAEKILLSEQADLIAMGRELMYNPFWPLHAAQELKVDPNFKLWPEQYRWAVSRRSDIKKFVKINRYK